jgi:hypothetical protein
VKKAGIVAAVVFAMIIVLFAMPLGTIWLRLHRNQPAAASLAADLVVRYPDVRANGTASYAEDVIYIGVWGPTDRPAQNLIRDWLAAERTNRRIGARGLVRFRDQTSNVDLAEMDF